MNGLRCYGVSRTKTLTLVSLFLFPLSLCLCLANAAFDLNTIPFNDGFSHLFGDGNLVRSPDGKAARLLLDRFTGKIDERSEYYYYERALLTLLYDFILFIYIYI